MPPSRCRRRLITNLRFEREREREANIPPTVLVTTTCRLVTGISPRPLFFISRRVLRLLLTTAIDLSN